MTQIKRGKYISGVIEGAEVIVKVEGWWRVCHQSTDFLMIGMMITPTTEIKDAALSPFCLLSIEE